MKAENLDTATGVAAEAIMKDGDGADSRGKQHPTFRAQTTSNTLTSD
jgi:hypothetical protein